MGVSKRRADGIGRDGAENSLEHDTLAAEDGGIPPFQEGLLGAVDDAYHLGVRSLWDAGQQALGGGIVDINPLLDALACRSVVPVSRVKVH